MKLSFSTLATPDNSAGEAIEFACKFGYSGIDLRVSDYKGELTLHSSKQEIKNIKNMLQNNGIECSGLLCYNSVGSKEASSWYKMEEEIKRCIEIGEELETKILRLFTGKTEEESFLDEFLNRTANSFSNVLRTEKTKLKFLLQNHRLNSTAHQAIEIIQKVSDDRMGMIFSPDHCFIVNEETKSIFEFILKYTKQLYFADYINENGSYKHMLPGTGSVPLAEIYNEFLKINFDGWISFKWEKIWHNDIESAKTALPVFIDFMAGLQRFSIET